MPKKIVVIGTGFAGLSAACCLAKEGCEVTVLEKNATAGGRARLFEQSGFTFDMGPSWYWMPDVFEKFFNHFGKKVEDYYSLKRLDPSYKIFFGEQEALDIPANYYQLLQLFDQLEPGSGEKLNQFLSQARQKYEVGMHHFVRKPGQSFTEFLNFHSFKNFYKLDLLQPFEKHLNKYFKDPRIIQLLTFPILFLGATPKETPALYSLMNYADIKLGTWYPMGGMHEIVRAMVRLAESLDVRFVFNQEVTSINLTSGVASSVSTVDEQYACDMVVAGGDYHFIESNCLPPSHQSYDKKYWDSRTLSPSSLIFYLGVDKKLPGLEHHNLFFDSNLKRHMDEIYTNPKWPSDPLFYVSATSKTDDTVCPDGCENLFVLIPAAPGLEDTEEIRDYYYELVIDRLETNLGVELHDSVVYKRSYAHRNFIQDYHAFKGNAYGLANTLSQTAFLKPKIRSKKVSNLYYTGQLTVPGPGVPPSLISGQIVAEEIIKKIGHETAV